MTEESPDMVHAPAAGWRSRTPGDPLAAFRGRYMTTEEVATLLRTAPETVRYWRWKKVGPPSFKVGRRVLYDVARLEAWIADREGDSR